MTCELCEKPTIVFTCLKGTGKPKMSLWGLYFDLSQKAKKDLRSLQMIMSKNPLPFILENWGPGNVSVQDTTSAVIF